MVTTGRCYLLLVGGSQGGRSAPYNVRDSPPAENNRPHLWGAPGQRRRLDSTFRPAARPRFSSLPQRDAQKGVPSYSSSPRSQSPLLPQTFLASNHCLFAPCDAWVIPGAPSRGFAWRTQPLCPPSPRVSSSACYLAASTPNSLPLASSTPPHLVLRTHLGPHSLRAKPGPIPACPGRTTTPQQARHPPAAQGQTEGSAPLLLSPCNSEPSASPG